MKKALINPDVEYENIIPLEDIRAIYGPECQRTVRNLEAQQLHRTVASLYKFSLSSDIG